MNKFSFLIFILITLASCKEKFEKSGWIFKDDMEYPKREEMVKDLVENHKLKGLTYAQTIDLLGYGEAEGNKLIYEITVDYGLDIDPVYIKSLEIDFTKDSIVNKFKIVEWKK